MGATSLDAAIAQAAGANPPEYLGIDPVDRVCYDPGQVAHPTLVYVTSRPGAHARMSYMVPTAADYEWFTQSEDIAIAENYCLTLLKGISAEELVRRINGTVERQFPSLQELWDMEAEVATSPVVAITTIGDWVFMAESGSLIGGSTSTAIPLSMQAVLVSHMQSVDLDAGFLHIVDGDVQLSFSPMYPTVRKGSRPNALMDAMREAGFDLGEEPAASASSDHSGAAFALAEIVTGVRLTADTLDSLTYSYVTIEGG